MVDTAASIFRDFVTDGVPASGKWAPLKPKIREWGAWLEGVINGGLAAAAVSSIASLKALDTTAFTKATLLDATRFGDFVWTPGDFSAQVAADTLNGVYIKANAIAATVGAWVRVCRPAEFHIRWFGVAGVASGTPNDDAAAFQIACNLLTGGGVIFVDQKIYGFGSSVTTNAPVVLRSVSNDTEASEVTTNTNGGGASVPRIKWLGGSSINAMFTVKPAVTGNLVFGGGAQGIEWDGNALISTGVHLDNTEGAILSGSARNFTFAGGVISSVSGSTTAFSKKNRVPYWRFIWGTAAACQPAHGLVLRGNGSTIPATQQLIGSVFGLVYNGSLLYIAETDNAQVASLHGVVQSGGTGFAMAVWSGGAQGANNNVVEYAVGPIYCDTGTYGTMLKHYNSEAGGIYGSGEWNAKIVEYSAGDVFRSPTYKLRDKIALRHGDFLTSGMTAAATFAGQWFAPGFPNGVDSWATVVLPAPYDLPDGQFTGIEVLCGTKGTSGGNALFQITASQSAVPTSSGGPIVTPTINAEAHVQAVSAGNNLVNVYSMTFGAPLAFTKGNAIFLTIKRVGADALDTNSDEIAFLGARLLFKATGPGNYTIPNWN